MSTKQTFGEKVLDLYFDDYFKGIKGHSDWTDEQISMSTVEADIEDFLKEIRQALIDGI